MTPSFDTRHIRRAFSRAARSYHAAARLQHEIEARLLDSLLYLDDRIPEVVLDLGCGPGTATHTMQQRWPKARILALDLSLDMLRQLPKKPRSFLTRRPTISRICADARALPLADHSVDVLFSNLCLQWLDDLPTVLAGCRRILKPGGLLLCSTFGPDTLWELHDAFAVTDNLPHISPFASIAELGDTLMHAGFRDPVLDRDIIIHHYPNLPILMHELRAIGATNAMTTRRRSLTARARFTAAASAYESHRTANGQLPATWEILTLMAWSPAPGTPIRHGGADTAHFPANAIPIRRRK